MGWSSGRMKWAFSDAVLHILKCTINVNSTIKYLFTKPFLTHFRDIYFLTRTSPPPLLGGKNMAYFRLKSGERYDKKLKNGEKWRKKKEGRFFSPNWWQVYILSPYQHKRVHQKKIIFSCAKIYNSKVSWKIQQATWVDNGDGQ